MSGPLYHHEAAERAVDAALRDLRVSRTAA